jgi:uncharacterized membrane protein
MSEQYVPPPVQDAEVSSDDRLWTLLNFLITPLFPIITLLMDTKKNRPFIKYHTIPTLILGIVEIVVAGVLAFIPVVWCLGLLLWIINIIYGIKAYKGVYTDLPVITKFAKDQGWS